MSAPSRAVSARREPRRARHATTGGHPDTRRRSERSTSCHDPLVVGAVARSQQRAEELWTATGFTEDPPRLADDELLLIVAGGESGTCPWRLPSIMLSADGESVRFELGDHEDEPCTDDWNPRAIAVTAADPTLDEDVDLEVAYRGTVHTAEPIDPDVAYAEPPFHRDSDEEVEVPGEVFLVVRLEPASGHVEDRKPGYEGPDRVTARTPAETEAVLEAALVADHDGGMAWIVGITDEERPFRVEAEPETGVLRIEVAREPSTTP